jgi:transcriptional regulator with GAF, ATPase, and Fis domain
VKVNCAAIPTELLETELFGHEKGSFTGATGARRGKFELADGGTHLPRRSGRSARRIAGQAAARAAGRRVPPRGRRADHSRQRARDFRHQSRSGGLVAQEKFREDLYYRLSVVPIRVPSLRERPHDIRLLAEYFLEEFCARNNFRAKKLDDTVFPVLESYAWPGNARELRNVVERMAILTPAKG